MALKHKYTGEAIPENIDPEIAAILSGVAFPKESDYLRLSPQEKQEQLVAENMQATVEKVESGNLQPGDVEMVARSFIDGLWLNKSEEVGSYIAAIAFKALQPDLAKGKSVGQIQKEMLGNLEAQSARFQEERPGLAITSNIAGGILSPASLAGGQALAQASRMRNVSTGAQAADDVAATLGGQFAARSDESLELAKALSRGESALPTVAGAPKQAVFGIPTAPLSAPVASTLSKVSPTKALAGVAATEGAVFGFEGQTLEEKVQNAAFTAGVSATVPFAFAGVKKLYDGATENRMAQQLGKGQDFLNLMFTDGLAGSVYRSVVSKAYGGKTLTEQQARKVAGRAITPTMAKEESDRIIENAAKELDRAKRIIGRESKENQEQVTQELEDRIAAAKIKFDEATTEIGQREAREELAITEQAKQNKAVREALKLKDADEAVSVANASFRGQTLRASAPPGAPEEEILALGSMDPQAALRHLDRLWSEYGFTTVNNLEYKVNPNALDAMVGRVQQQYPELALLDSGAFPTKIKKYLASELELRSVDGVISGRDLIQIRSNVARAINNLSDGSSTSKQFAKEVQAEIDTLLESGLKPNQIAELEADRFAWSVKSIADSATARASGGDAASGAYTAKEWLESVKSYSARFAARAQGRFQQEAQTLAKLNEQNKKNILAKANKDVEAIKLQAVADKTKLQESIAQAERDLKIAHTQQVRELRRQAQVEGTSVASRQALQERIAQAQRDFKINLADLEKQRIRAKNETEALKRLMPSSFDASVFESLFNTALIGQASIFAGRQLGLVEGAQAFGSSLATGFIGARLLATEVGQRLIAKQTEGQKAIRRGVSQLDEKVQASLQSIPLGRGATLTGSEVAYTQPTGAVAGIGEALAVTEGTLYNEQTKETIRSLPKSSRAKIYRKLEANGKLERLRAEDPKFARELKRATQD